MHMIGMAGSGLIKAFKKLIIVINSLMPILFGKSTNIKMHLFNHVCRCIACIQYFPICY
jgi:hypothetical protein